MNPVRVVLIEDHTLIRAGVRALLKLLDFVDVVAESDTGLDGLIVVAAQQPDVVLLDITLPGLNGLEVAARIHKEQPRTRVIMLSMHSDHTFVRRSFQAGASGYIVKGAGVPELELAIRAVMRGEVYLSPAVSRDVIESYREGTGERTPLELLTPRQREILQLIAEGHSTKAIAQRLGLSAKTVEFHRAQMMGRLKIHEVAGLVRFAIRSGVVSSES